MFNFTRSLRKQRLADERGKKYSFDKEYNSWLIEHSMFVLFGICIDVMNNKGPLLSSLLAGISFMRLFLRLVEKNEAQVWTLPNLVTGIRILGVFCLAAYSLHHHESDKEEAEGISIEEAFVYSDYWVSLYGVAFVVLDIVDGFLARSLNQCTQLGAYLDGQADAVGTSFLALTLLSKGKMNTLLAVHMASAAYLYSVFPKIFPPRIVRKFGLASHPHARPCAGLMAFLALLSVLVPVFDSFGFLSTTVSTVTVSNLSSLSANLSGMVNLGSFMLSYYALFQAVVQTEKNHEHNK